MKFVEINKNLFQEVKALTELQKYIDRDCEQHIIEKKTKWIQSAKFILENLKENFYGIENITRAEQEIDMLTNDLRILFLEYFQNFSNKHMKSPYLNTIKQLPSGKNIQFSYERNIQSEVLESKANEYRMSHTDWEINNIFFSSGMSAIYTIIQCFSSMLKPTEDDPLFIWKWGAYFETRVALDLIERSSIRVFNAESQDIMRDLDKYKIFFIEPVKYNWDLELFNIDNFLTKIINDASSELKILILDTTLSGNLFEMENILNALRKSENIILIHVNSCLKLEQQGLELSNCGLLSIYTSKLNSNLPTAYEIGEYVKKVRTIIGTGLTLEEICLLDNGFFLNSKISDEYSKSVFFNNELLAKSDIRIDGIFEKVVHPSKNSSLKWAASPFVIFHLKEDFLENHGFLLGVLSKEAEESRISFGMGSSFGFRNHRFEVIIPNIQEGRGLLKLAMGGRKDYSRYKIIEIMKKLSRYADFQELRRNYVDVKEVDFKNL